MQVDTAGWLQRTKQEKGASSLSIMQSRKNLMRAHVVALVLDAEEVCHYIMLFSLHILS
jgi:predicted GTPase